MSKNSIKEELKNRVEQIPQDGRLLIDYIADVVDVAIDFIAEEVRKINSNV